MRGRDQPFAHRAFSCGSQAIRRRPHGQQPRADSAISCLPASDAEQVEGPGFPQVVPTEYHADLVLTLARGAPVMALVAEVQLARDATKPCTRSNFKARSAASGSARTPPTAREEGREEGRLLAQAKSILAVLSAREITVPPEDQARIDACRDLVSLRRRHARAVGAESVAEIFA